MRALTDSERRELVLRALRTPRGRYAAERAAQLSGIPRSTVYDWQRNGVLVPDFSGGSPMMWSYRDLVYLRLLAWLRNRGMPRPAAAVTVKSVRDSHTAGDLIEHVRTDGDIVLLNSELQSRNPGQQVLPSLDLVRLLAPFDLLEPEDDLGRRPLWGPDLITPSDYTFISPWVLAGEPCVHDSRVPTASLWALRAERGLSASRVAALYPGLAEGSIEDAWELEDRLRRAA